MNKFIIGIDPGTTESGYVVWPTSKCAPSVIESATLNNADLLRRLDAESWKDTTVAIEWIQSMGMAVGKTTFETCLWVGRFVGIAQNNGAEVRCIPRGQIKLHHCHSARAKDGNIAQALRDKYGEKGTKAEPGFFYGVSKHAWQACAVAAYVAEGAESEKELRF